MYMNALTGSAAGGSIFMFGYMALLIGVFYFLLIRPQRKEQKRITYNVFLFQRLFLFFISKFTDPRMAIRSKKHLCC